MPIITVMFRDRPVAEYPLGDEGCRIGRAPDNDLVIDSLSFRRHHAIIEFENDAPILRPVDTHAEIWIGESMVTEAQLYDGRTFRIGKHFLTYQVAHTGDEPVQIPGVHAGLQVLAGPYVGRIIRLIDEVTRVGTPGEAECLIRNHAGGYLLEGIPDMPSPRANGVDIDHHPYQLGNGDRVQISGQEYHFFEQDAAPLSSGANAPQRRFTRVAFDAPATLGNDDSTWTTQVIDLSLNGALVLRPGLWPENTPEQVSLHVRLQNGEEITMQTRVAHVHDAEIGLECIDLPLDDVTRLRRLIELNLADDKLLKRELSALA